MTVPYFWLYQDPKDSPYIAWMSPICSSQTAASVARGDLLDRLIVRILEHCDVLYEVAEQARCIPISRGTGPTCRLVVDEVGYLPLDRAEANMAFQLVSRRYERGTMIIASNKSFTEWGGVLGDDVLATAILDRLCITAT